MTRNEVLDICIRAKVSCQYKQKYGGMNRKVIITNIAAFSEVASENLLDLGLLRFLNDAEAPLSITVDICLRQEICIDLSLCSKKSDVHRSSKEHEQMAAILELEMS